MNASRARKARLNAIANLLDRSDTLYLVAGAQSSLSLGLPQNKTLDAWASLDACSKTRQIAAAIPTKSIMSKMGASVRRQNGAETQKLEWIRKIPTSPSGARKRSSRC